MPFTKLALILGDRLVPDHSGLGLEDDTIVFMAEHPDLAEHFDYHSHKLVLFFAAMRAHAERLRQAHEVVYWRLEDVPEGTSFTDLLDRCLTERGISRIVTYDIEDRFFDEAVRTFCVNRNVAIQTVPSPTFLTTQDTFEAYRESHTRLFQHEFYQWQRTRLDILMDGDQPRNGRWSFDDENRKKLPKRIDVPALMSFARTEHERDAIDLVAQRYPDNPGDPEAFWLPTTRERSLRWLDDFFERRFERFGPYEDAMSSEHRVIFHSVLSPLLNLGLLTPREVIDRAISYAEEHDTHYPSLEGFVRQIIGWREFVRGVYQSEPEMASSNFFEHERGLTRDWYEGTTGIVPLDDAISKAKRYGYLHHIERLMIVGNLMTLSGIHPDEIYRWFMELFVDSADWVMVPNVYGMLFADGGTFATKPYVAASNYLRKMSDYPSGDWCDVVDGLYWRFIEQNRSRFASNARMSMMLGALERMDEGRRDMIFSAAERFIATCTRPRNV